MLEGVGGESGVNAGGAHPYVLPALEPGAGGLVAFLDASLQVVNGGGAGVVVLEVPDELGAYLLAEVDVADWEGVDPLPCVAI
jgi:hypothetical protein